MKSPVNVFFNMCIRLAARREIQFGNGFPPTWFDRLTNYRSGTEIPPESVIPEAERSRGQIVDMCIYGYRYFLNPFSRKISAK